MMRVTSIRGLPVVDSTAPRQAGVVADVILDLVSRRVVAIDVAHGDNMLAHRVPIDYVDSIDKKSVRVPESHVFEALASEKSTNYAASARSFLGVPVLNDEGQRVGWLRDLRLSSEDLSLEGFEVSERVGLLPQATRLVRPSDVIACSSDALVVKRAMRPSEATEQRRAPAGMPFGRKMFAWASIATRGLF